MNQLTAKELTAIEEQLGEEEVLVKKFNYYASITQDTQLKQMYQDIANKHQGHYDMLFQNL